VIVMEIMKLKDSSLVILMVTDLEITMVIMMDLLMVIVKPMETTRVIHLGITMDLMMD